KDRGPFIHAHTATALNFQLTMVIVNVVAVVTWLLFIGVLIWIAASVLIVIFCIMAAVAANNGQTYTYPLAIRFVQ
ncbi:MAG: DUF4870 domain-containing protein, partial [Salinibacterium sp.]